MVKNHFQLRKVCCNSTRKKRKTDINFTVIDWIMSLVTFVALVSVLKALSDIFII